MEDSDKILIDRYRAGDTDALETLVLRYKGPLFGYIVNMTEGRGDPDEVFQEVWFRAIKKLDSYRQDNFPGWLMRIARNMVIDRARKKKPLLTLDEEHGEGRTFIETVKGRMPGPDSRAEAEELGERIADAVASLPLEQKETFLLRMKAGLSFKEIAEMQDISINTALARMQYALAKLKPILRDDYEAVRTGS